MSAHFGPSQSKHGSTARLQTATERGAASESHTRPTRHPIFEGVVKVCQAPTFRFNLLRILCVSALMAFLHDIHLTHEYEASIFVLVLAPLIMIHHIASAFGPTLALPAILDVLLAVGEVAAICLSLHYHKSTSVWSSTVYLWSFTAWVFMLVSTLLLTLVRIVDQIAAFRDYDSVVRCLWRRYDFTDTRAASGSNSGRWGAFRVLTGTRLWLPLFRGETNWIVYLRGVLTVLVISFMIMFATFNIVLDPVRETGMVPVKEQRSVGLPSDFKVTKPTVWSLVVQRRVEFTDEQQQDGTLLSAVTVTPLWRKPEGGPPCTGNTDQTLQLEDIQTVIFNCPPSQPIPKESSKKLLPLPYQYSQPDLLVSVNFTLLNISSDSLEDIPLNSVQIMLGLTSKAQDIARTTVPTTLIPGVNLVGMANLAVRQHFAAPGLSALGLLDIFAIFAVAEMGHVWPDPRAAGEFASDVIPRGPGIGTFRISLQNARAEYKLLQEYRDKSILRGFASVGGLWTFLGGLFSAFFGSSLMRLFFGSKPLTVYGLAHSFQRDRIKQACVSEYPQVQHDVNAPLEERGVLKLLCDHLIDLDFLLFARDNDRRSSHATDTGNQTSKDEAEMHYYSQELQYLPKNVDDHVNEVTR